MLNAQRQRWTLSAARPASPMLCKGKLNTKDSKKYWMLNLENETPNTKSSTLNVERLAKYSFQAESYADANLRLKLTVESELQPIQRIVFVFFTLDFSVKL